MFFGKKKVEFKPNHALITQMTLLKEEDATPPWETDAQAREEKAVLWQARQIMAQREQKRGQGASL